MSKTKSYFKILIFIVSALGFLDLIINPKPIDFLNSEWNLITSILTVLALAILVSKEISGSKLEVSSKILFGIKIGLLGLMLIYLNVFLKNFDFTQNIEYTIVTYHTLPIIYILNDLASKKIKPKYFAIAGIIILFPTLIYFSLIHGEYYAVRTHMIYAHQRIRNWLCCIGILLILTSLLRKSQYRA